MSDDERIAQMLFVGFEGQMPSEELRDLAGARHVGGIVLYGASGFMEPYAVRSNPFVLSLARSATIGTA